MKEVVESLTIDAKDCTYELIIYQALTGTQTDIIKRVDGVKEKIKVKGKKHVIREQFQYLLDVP